MDIDFPVLFDAVDFKKEKQPDGWYKYSDTNIEFVYPGVLKKDVKNGNGWTIACTDEDYFIGINASGGSFPINFEHDFSRPTNETARNIRISIDSVLSSQDILPSRKNVMDHVSVHSVKSDWASKLMLFDIKVYDESFSMQIDWSQGEHPNIYKNGYYSQTPDKSDFKQMILAGDVNAVHFQKGAKWVRFYVYPLKNLIPFHKDFERIKDDDIYRILESVKVKNWGEQ